MKRSHDWYKLQQEYQGWAEIRADYDVLHRVQNQKWSFDIQHCHKSLANLLTTHACTKKTHTDFFVLTDLELSKLPLETLFKIIKFKYEQSSVGGYVAILSYYINNQKRLEKLGDSYPTNIDTVFRENFSYVRKIECVSNIIENPIDVIVDGQLLEGSNFIFVHPNIRYFLWK